MNVKELTREPAEGARHWASTTTQPPYLYLDGQSRSTGFTRSERKQLMAVTPLVERWAQRI